MEELGAFVIQLDQTHWQHELQVLSAMSVNSYGKWNTIEWEKDYTSPGYCNSTVVTIMHICIWETCKVYSVSQEHQRNSSTCECVSIHIHAMEALLTDERITTAERILTFNSETRTIDLFHVVQYCFLNNALSLYGCYDCT